MDMSQPKIIVAKLVMLAALACGIIGLIAGLSDSEWKLGVTGWFTGGTLVAVLSLVVLADHFRHEDAGSRLKGTRLSPASTRRPPLNPDGSWCCGP